MFEARIKNGYFSNKRGKSNYVIRILETKFNPRKLERLLKVSIIQMLLKLLLKGYQKEFG